MTSYQMQLLKKAGLPTDPKYIIGTMCEVSTADSPDNTDKITTIGNIISLTIREPMDQVIITIAGLVSALYKNGQWKMLLSDDDPDSDDLLDVNIRLI